MKQFRQIPCNSLIVVVIFFLPIIFVSCNYYNFSSPQPADKENTYEFPPSFRGTWVEKPLAKELAVDPRNSFPNYLKGPSYTSLSKNLAVESNINEIDSAWYHIEKDYVLFIVHDREKIAAGAWILTDKSNSSAAPAINSSKKIQYHFPSGISDTINYLIREDKIYEISDERFLEKGYSFVLENDTLVVLKYDTICVDLGQNAFLRKLNDRFSVLNIRNTILGEENVWWRLIVLETNNEDNIKIWECNSKTGELPSKFYSRSIKNDIFYFDSKWPAGEMLDLIKKGYFSLSSTLIRIQDQPNN